MIPAIPCGIKKHRIYPSLSRSHLDPQTARPAIGVESAPALRRGVGFDAPTVRAGPFGGGENRGEPVRAQWGDGRLRSVRSVLFEA